MGLTLDWQDQRWRLLPERALYWEDRATLILSDLHLGKAEDFQAAGVPVPSSVHDEDLARLRTLLERLAPERVYVLGDFVHSNRIVHTELARKFRALHGSARWTLALGNHDVRARERLVIWGFDAVVDDVLEEGLIFCHDEGACAGPVISGHVHPVVRVGGVRDRLRLPCFVFGRDRVLLPSFGAFTGGYEIARRRSERVFAVCDEAVLEVPPPSR